MTRIGIVGAGGMGTVHHSNYAHIPDCEVVAVVGASDKDRENAAAWGLPLYATIAEMAAAEDPDVVDVCTPTFLHKAHASEALNLGKNVILEKPCALTKADAAALFDLAEAKGVHLYVAQVVQFTPEITVLRQVLDSGVYGKPLDAVFERLSACPRWAQGGWLFDKTKSGLVPFDLHIHDLDVIVSLFGKPKTVSYTTCGGADKGYAEQYRFTYGYDGMNVVGEAAWFNADIPFTARWRVYFEDGMLINDGQAVTGYRFGEEPKVFDTEEKVKIPTGINVPPTGWYLTELTHFLDCIRAGVPTPRVTREQVLNVLEILEAAIQ
ncbi:dehydrogenase [Oscillospiraceae bacterium]|nr:dehydrogenase [Oscillospiraceae bacterium]